MTTQHTQGEWTIKKFEDETLTIKSDDRSICDIIGIMKPDEANARLIAAAPKLLETLRQIANGQTMQGEFTHAQTVLAYQELARRAVAKVEGAQ